MLLPSLPAAAVTTAAGTLVVGATGTGWLLMAVVQ